MHWGYNYYGGWWFGMLVPIILIAAVVYAVIKLSGNKFINYNRDYDNSLNILKERFAKGEISKEEYMEKKEIIMK